MALVETRTYYVGTSTWLSTTVDSIAKIKVPETMTREDIVPKPTTMPAGLEGLCNDVWSWEEQELEQDFAQLELGGIRNRTVIFHPTWSRGTVAVRATKPIDKNGVHYWEIRVSDRLFGTSMMFGIGSSKTRVNLYDFINVLGENEHSWGLNHKGILWHKGVDRPFAEPFAENTPTTVGLLYCKGTLTYYRDGKCLGEAFKGLEKYEGDLFPMIASTAAKTEMVLGATKREYPSLQDRCRAVISACVQEAEDCDKLKLPSRLINYIKEFHPA
ncbi:PREDICTED: SPRY domain-containing SOCS box protein 3-like [Branchiostoma belcheri]|uniref:SPRY domain-containing SOCS box protein 3 n=1 Tax=Branchiostoma belcheri TaxID=7741 RepID=A0A6P4ZKH2_BRABE|nr:PREDICTED: SPRY domain-containing SOCS box protein 3-like [Branchiostoma belcheri]